HLSWAAATFFPFCAMFSSRNANNQENLMNLHGAGKLALVAGLMLAFAGCHSTQECGTWVFTGTPSGNSFPLSSAFTFNPANCGKTCQCNKDVMIQMTWVYDADTHTNIY